MALRGLLASFRTRRGGDESFEIGIEETSRWALRLENNTRFGREAGPVVTNNSLVALIIAPRANPILASIDPSASLRTINGDASMT